MHVFFVFFCFSILYLPPHSLSHYIAMTTTALQRETFLKRKLGGTGRLGRSEIGLQGFTGKVFRRTHTSVENRLEDILAYFTNIGPIHFHLVRTCVQLFKYPCVYVCVHTYFCNENEIKRIGKRGKVYLSVTVQMTLKLL